MTRDNQRQSETIRPPTIMTTSNSPSASDLIARAKAILAKNSAAKSGSSGAPASSATVLSPGPNGSVVRTELQTPPITTISHPIRSKEDILTDIFLSEGMEANPEQMAFVQAALTGKDCILVGAAGTGKTTTQGMMVHALQALNKIGRLHESTKWLSEGSPAIAICSFTNKAVNNIRNKMPADLKACCHTIHKLLEFAPVWFEIEDPENPGEYKKTMRFVPQRNRYNPLLSSLEKIVIEESSMVDTTLYNLLMDACPHKPQVILLGDIHQLPPFEGESILGYALCDWPIIELTKIYRQAAESPIISLAWKIKSGEIIDPTTVADPANPKRIKVPAFDSLCVDGKLHIRPWQTKLDELAATITATQFFCKLEAAGEYNPVEDIILIPFNKNFGSVELNKGISQYLGEKRGAVVHEVIAGFNKHYLAVGDKVMYAKEDCIILDIIRNAEYLGKSPQLASKTLDRWGHERGKGEASKSIADKDIEDIDKFLEAAVADGEDRVNKSSHTIILQRLADDEEVEISSAGEINNIIGGYAITVHKAQGSEWRKVFVCFHHTHATLLSREMLYTAITRAREELFIICEPNSLKKGVQSQRITGDTIEEKLEWFKKKRKEKEIKKQLELKIKERNEVKSAK